VPEIQDFDPTVYFDITAKNLLRNFGDRALYYADEALRKMRALGDEEGFEMWLGVRTQLEQRMRDAAVPAGATLH